MSPSATETTMAATSTSRETTEALRNAEAALDRRRHGGRTFGSTRAALTWYFEAAARMQGAHGVHPRTEVVNALTGERARVDVDGGRGGDLDDVLATLCTIREALAGCARDYPRGCAALVAILRDGKSQASVADTHKVSQSSISAEVGRAEAYVTGVLRSGGVLR